MTEFNLFNRCKRGAAILLAALLLASSAVACQPKKGSSVQSSETVLSSESEQTLKAFLDRFVRWYPVSADGRWEYDCAAPADGSGNLLASIATPASCAEWTLYSDVTEEECFVEKTDDPRGWAKETYAYYMFDAETVEFIAREIFNANGDAIALLTEQGESSSLFYKEGGRYYTLYEGTLDSYSDVSLISVGLDGSRYFVRFSADSVRRSDSNELMHYSGICDAELELKTISGREYWSLYRFKASRQ